MDWNQRLCIIFYSIVLIQCTVILTITLIKVKRNAAVYSMCIIEVLIILWLIFGMVEIQSKSTEELLLAVRFTLFPISMGGGVWLIFALLYSELITGKNIGIMSLIMVPKILAYLPTVTHRYFDLAIIYKSFEDPSMTVWGSFSKFNFSLNFAYTFVGVAVILIKSFIDYRKLKLRVLVVALAPLFSLILSMLLYYDIIEDPGFDFTPVTFSLFALLLSLAIFRFKSFDVLHDAAIGLFRETKTGIVIIDDRNHIIDYNDSAEEEFRDFLPRYRNEPVSEFLLGMKDMSQDTEKIDGILEVLEQPFTDYETNISLNVDARPENRTFYALRLRKISRKSGERKGFILEFSNRTSQSIELLNTERHRISGDLHDHLSNMINVVSMNIEYAMKNYIHNESELTCMQTAYDATGMIRINLRRILDELSPLDISDIGTVNALESLFKRIVGSGFKIDFTHIGIHDQLNYNIRYGMVIYNACMEGINNSIYNGKADEVSIVLSYKRGLAKLLISDDGIGCEEVIFGRGLKTMEKRIKSLNGYISYDSVDGEGFTLSVELPFEM